jgi:hypothetical protein
MDEKLYLAFGKFEEHQKEVWFYFYILILFLY